MEFLANIRCKIHSLKNPGSLHDIERIPVLSGEQEVVTLRAVPSVLEGDASNDAQLMAAWRNNNKESFFSWINATEQSTTTWLENFYNDNDEDIIFMVETNEKIPFGHLSLYNFSQDGRSCEFGRVVRGLSIGPNGGLTLATQFLLSWAVSNFGVERIFLEVFEDNSKATALYERCGFSVIERIALRKSTKSNGVYWEKITDVTKDGYKPDSFALKMEITNDQIPGNENT